MTSIWHRVPWIAIALLLTSCGGGDAGDRGEELMADQFQLWEDMAEVLDDLAAGGEMAEALGRIQSLGKASRDIAARRQELFGEMGSVEQQEFENEFSEQAAASAKKLTRAIQNLEKSGRATDEIAQAIMDMKTK